MNQNGQPSFSNQTPARRSWYSLLQAGAAGFAFLGLFLLGSSLFLYGLIAARSNSFDANLILSNWLPASSFLFLGLLFLPSVVFGLAHWFGLPIPENQMMKFPSSLILLAIFLVVVIIGHQLSQSSSALLLLLPLVHVLGISLPVVFFLRLGLNQLPAQSLQRSWGAFNSGLGLAPVFILIFESLALIGFLLLIGFWISIHPDLIKEISQLISLLKQSRPTADATLKLIQPYLSQPMVVTTILIFSAIVIPIIEEAIKPIGVYFLYGKIQGELAGFIIGALSGGGYALLESFLFSSNGNDWTQAILSRSATAVIHIFTSALMGSAIAQVWLDKKYLRLVLAYGCSVFFHGSWNGLAMLYTLQIISGDRQGIWQNPLIHNLATYAPLLLLFLFLYVSGSLWFFRNIILKQSSKISFQAK